MKIIIKCTINMLLFYGIFLVDQVHVPNSGSAAKLLFNSDRYMLARFEFNDSGNLKNCTGIPNLRMSNLFVYNFVRKRKLLIVKQRFHVALYDRIEKYIISEIICKTGCANCKNRNATVLPLINNTIQPKIEVQYNSNINTFV